MVKTSPSNAGGGCRFDPGSGSEDPTSHMSCGQKTKTVNRSNIVRNSIKTLKLVPH